MTQSLSSLRADGDLDEPRLTASRHPSSAPRPSAPKSIGVLTSGGDAPGMNAAVRAIVRVGLQRGLRVVGVRHGYSGLVSGDFVELRAFSVSNIIQHGGTMLKTARCDEFRTPEGRAKAAEHMRRIGLDALVLIGGNGTFEGGCIFAEETGFPVVGIPATIDNDLYGTDHTIGYDTAVNTAIYAIDKIRDTADALERTFYIEVMGRSTGFIALDVGLSCGAEYIAIPEMETSLQVLLDLFQKQRATKRSNIIIVAEGFHMSDSELPANAREEGNPFSGSPAFQLAHEVWKMNAMDYRVTILGHIQRGGSPTGRDRVLATRLGAAAVEAILDGCSSTMIGEIDGILQHTPLAEAWKRSKKIDASLLDLAALLAA